MTESEQNRGEEAVVLVGYASLMESVQRLEWALKRLAIQKDEGLNDLSFDEAWRGAERTMRRAIGALQGQVPAGLVDELDRLRKIRNHLAHEVLLRWRFEIGLGLIGHEEVIEGLAETANEFDTFVSQLDALAELHLRELGIDPAELELGHEELREILSSAE